jgi:hypothetical protein
VPPEHKVGGSNPSGRATFQSESLFGTGTRSADASVDAGKRILDENAGNSLAGV